MSWSLIRRESIIASQELLRKQSDDIFNWMEESTVGMFGEEKDVHTTQPTAPFTPGSPISSGPSSASSSPCPASKKDSFDDDDSSDSDHSDCEPFTFDTEYSVIDGVAYPASSLPQPPFIYNDYLPLAPQDALSPITEVRHLPQLPASRGSTPYLPLPPPFEASGPSPIYHALPLAPQPPSQRRQQSKLPHTPRSKKTKHARSKLALAEDSDRDADGESDDDGSDEEYVPSPRLGNTRKRARRPSFDSWSFASATNPSSSSSKISALDHRPTKRIRNSPPSRNVQVSGFSEPIDEIELSFKCPECGWIQYNKRMPDFKRHLRTHTRPNSQDQSQGWWCKGVLASTVPGFHGEGYQFAGQLRVGGCLKTFSRRDALKRHLDNPNVPCMGCIDD